LGRKRLGAQTAWGAYGRSAGLPIRVGARTTISQPTKLANLGIRLGPMGCEQQAMPTIYASSVAAADVVR